LQKNILRAIKKALGQAGLIGRQLDEFTYNQHKGARLQELFALRNGEHT
jgi:hypothetical protein